jgi:hypothetical protein
MMRKLTGGLVFVLAAVAMEPVLNAQEPAPFVAIRDCQINQGEFTAFREARQAVVDYSIANPIETPGRFIFMRGALNNISLYQLVWFGENLGEWDEWNRLRFQARRDDPELNAVFREMGSHLNSCNWTFTRRIVN